MHRDLHKRAWALVKLQRCSVSAFHRPGSSRSPLVAEQGAEGQLGCCRGGDGYGGGGGGHVSALRRSPAPAAAPTLDAPQLLLELRSFLEPTLAPQLLRSGSRSPALQSQARAPSPLPGTLGGSPALHPGAPRREPLPTPLVPRGGAQRLPRPRSRER